MGWQSSDGLVYSRPTARVVELVDTTDSKSVAFTGVPVQVRPLVPNDEKARFERAFLCRASGAEPDVCSGEALASE
tara:strand:+ start:265 stop:492 length:228 start_codon:yes stop_codon:yes gene_type:complete